MSPSDDAMKAAVSDYVQQVAEAIAVMSDEDFRSMCESRKFTEVESLELQRFCMALSERPPKNTSNT